MRRPAPGWWAYLVVQTEPTGLSYCVRAGFGPKNDPDGLRDALPELTLGTVDEGLDALTGYLERGLYYLGSLRH